MGVKDTITKRFMSKAQHFADAFNYFLFDGKPVIKEKALTSMDPTEIGIILDKSGQEVVQKVRDVLKQCVLMQDNQIYYLILGIENQSDIHYAMPVRNMIYDGLNYGRQVTEIAAAHKKEKDLKGDEFLSGFSKRDKLKPVITLVVYFGNGKWDAPRTLKDMFDNIDESILQYVTDYKTNLIIPDEIKDFSKFKTELGKAMKYIVVSNDVEAYNNTSMDEEYRYISSETAQLLNVCAGYTISINDKEEIDMCEVVKEYKELGKAEGLAEGGLKILFKLVENKKLSLDDAADEWGVTPIEFKALMDDKNNK